MISCSLIWNLLQGVCSVNVFFNKLIAAHCFVSPISIVPIPSSSEEIRLVDDAFGKISHMVSDGSWMVRVQAAKTLVRKYDKTHRIHAVSFSFSPSINKKIETTH